MIREYIKLIKKLMIRVCGEHIAAATFSLLDKIIIEVQHQGHVLKLSDDLLESSKKLWELSRTRWKQCKPNSQLHWGVKVSGEAFISKVSSYGAFHPSRAILEVGAGGGRLLKTLIKQKVPFKNYTGVDISAANVNYLKETFDAPNINFVQADAEQVKLTERFDIVLSSLTFKHLFPSFEKALRNIKKCMNAGAMIFFDLIEGKLKYFEKDGQTYIRWYSRSEILEILRRCGLELVSFDYVTHKEGYTRLLVVAINPDAFNNMLLRHVAQNLHNI